MSGADDKNISLPAIIFASVVPSFTSSNISAFGGLTLVALIYMATGAVFGGIVKEIFYVPADFQWGILVVRSHFADYLES